MRFLQPQWKGKWFDRFMPAAVAFVIVIGLIAILVFVLAPWGNSLSDSDVNTLFVAAAAFGLGWFVGISHEAGNAKTRQKREDHEKYRQEYLAMWGAEDRLRRENHQKAVDEREKKYQRAVEEREEHLKGR